MLSLWLMADSAYVLCEGLLSPEMTLCCPLSVPVAASAGDLKTASPQGAGSSKAGLRSLGPCTPAPNVVSGMWEVLTSGCWLMCQPGRTCESLISVGRAWKEQRETSELVDTLAKPGYNVSVC